MYGLKPITLRHLDISKEQIRDFWLSYSQSSNVQWVVQQWNNIDNAMRYSKVRYEGKRKFIALACGQVSTLIKWKKLDNEFCSNCNRNYSVSNTFYKAFICSRCQISCRSGIAPSKPELEIWTASEILFVDQCRTLLISFWFVEWSNLK